jgi:fluoride exporter
MRTPLDFAVAGAAGALARYGLDGLISRRAALFPWGTFVVNVTGAFALGLLVTVFTERTTTAAWIGAYTTFSTLSLETYRLLEEGAVALALVNAVGSMAAGLLAVYATGDRRLRRGLSTAHLANPPIVRGPGRSSSRSSTRPKTSTESCRSSTPW